MLETVGDKCGRTVIGFVTSGKLRASGWLSTILATQWWFSAGLGLVLFCLSEVTGLDARFGRVWRDVVERVTEIHAGDWLVAGPRTLPWCAR